MGLKSKTNIDWAKTTASEKLELRGLWGEFYLNKALNSGLGAVRYKTSPHATYFLFDRIHIPSYMEKTTEIDSLLVCQKGIFSVEVKSWSGDAIYGERFGENWFYAKSRSKGNINSAITGNPFGQNDFHIRYLSNVLPERVTEAIFNVVLLVDASPFGINPGKWCGGSIEGLFTDPDSIVKAIQEMPNILSGGTVIECAKLLSKFSYGNEF